MRSAAPSWVATGRSESLFQHDVDVRQHDLRSGVRGARILVIGAAGSVGSATVRELVRHSPAALHLVDLSENNLVELVRDLRASRSLTDVAEFRTLPIDYGSEVCHRLLLMERPYDLVLNFAALKHVRSERDVCSLLQMIDTNILKQVRLLVWLAQSHGTARYFSVSTDKAANPVNLMGATKRFAEHVMFSPAFGCVADRCVTSARFANVAFSDGSLLFGWTRRLAKRQPLAAPRNTRRYFISAEEAGQICVLAAVLGGQGATYVPKLDPSADLKDLAEIARAFLETHGLRAQEYEDEALATALVEEDLASGRYPLLVTPRDTSGEKPYEEFLGSGERMIEVGMERLCAVKGRVAPEGTLRRVISEFENAVGDPSVTVTKDSLVHALSEVVNDLRHMDTGKSLDERL